MGERKLDSLIQETLEQQVSGISMSPDLQKQMKRKIHSKLEEKSMKRHISKRKVMVLAVAMCLIGSMAAVAAGKVVGWSSHTYVDRPDFVSLEEIGKAERKMGCEIQAVEAFSNGYRFEKGFIIDVEEIDENGVVMGTFPETSIMYKKGKGNVSLDVYPLDKFADDSRHKEIVKIPYGDITLTYTEDLYKFVPPEYQVSEEEKALMETGELYISYGTDEVEVEIIRGISWETEAGYLLMPSGDDGIGQAELVQMAKEIIDEGR